ncbi:uncharacterized protein F5147DRAFT_779244 [Suillus discolor]|uniref:SSD domain-containing protein n=1 Tax=Suillus discolor TaxID=1912936 RepID=A0A9P7JNF0_9AGAM|nr:uncharacterized protein F5147DRAFT_779244 [Suillus discolor]KAG2093730.1 hypothetical protein F5147DRAFT_779244 [Suillus discolor]
MAHMPSGLGIAPSLVLSRGLLVCAASIRMAHTAQALIMRFWELTMKPDSLNILPIVIGYPLKYASFIHLFFSPRTLGSNSKLSIAILSSSILAFPLALPISHHLEIPLDPIGLTLALPFFVRKVWLR